MTRGSSQVLAKRPVAAAGLGAAVEQMRKTAARHERAESEPASKSPTVRATLSNLVLLYTKQNDASQVDDVDRLVEELCIAHPSRFFIIACSEQELGVEQKTNGLLTEVSSRCVLARSGAHVCSEEIYLTTDAVGLAHVPSLLRSHLHADAPIVMVMLNSAQTPADIKDGQSLIAQCWNAISPLADKLFYDSAQFSKVSADCAGIHVDQATAGPKCIDLNWHRLSRWRNLVAEQFDIDQAKDPSKDIRSVTFEYFAGSTQGKKTIPAEVMLLCGWFICCLDWQDALSPGKNEREIEVARNDSKLGAAKLLFIEQGEGREDACLSKVSVLMGKQEEHISLSVRRLFEDSMIELETAFSALSSGQPTSCDLSLRRVPFVEPSLFTLLVPVLGPKALDTTARDAMRAVLRLEQALSS